MPETQWIQAGALLRGELRRFLVKHGISYTESKGWFESVFVLDCSHSEYLRVCRVIGRAWGK